jgi:hypothetical protein
VRIAERVELMIGETRLAWECEGARGHRCGTSITRDVMMRRMFIISDSSITMSCSLYESSPNIESTRRPRCIDEAALRAWRRSPSWRHTVMPDIRFYSGAHATWYQYTDGSACMTMSSRCLSCISTYLELIMCAGQCALSPSMSPARRRSTIRKR